MSIYVQTTVPKRRQSYREIEAAPLPDRYARGWHCLGLAKDFRGGKPHGIHTFGKKLVVFELQNGELAVLDAYCRHLGGDLSEGRIVGDTVACPFHDWRWGGDADTITLGTNAGPAAHKGHHRIQMAFVSRNSWTWS